MRFMTLSFLINDTPYFSIPLYRWKIPQWCISCIYADLVAIKSMRLMLWSGNNIYLDVWRKYCKWFNLLTVLHTKYDAVAVCCVYCISRKSTSARTYQSILENILLAESTVVRVKTHLRLGDISPLHIVHLRTRGLRESYGCLHSVGLSRKGWKWLLGAT